MTEMPFDGLEALVLRVDATGFAVAILLEPDEAHYGRNLRDIAKDFLRFAAGSKP